MDYVIDAFAIACVALMCVAAVPVCGHTTHIYMLIYIYILNAYLYYCW